MTIDTLRDSIILILSITIFVVFISIIILFTYNFIAVSDEKLFDAENKYINGSLPDPDIESNYKDTYKNKRNFDEIQLSLMGWFSDIERIIIVAFLSIFFLGLIFFNRKKILDYLKNYFQD